MIPPYAKPQSRRKQAEEQYLPRESDQNQEADLTLAYITFTANGEYTAVIGPASEKQWDSPNRFYSAADETVTLRYTAELAEEDEESIINGTEQDLHEIRDYLEEGQEEKLRKELQQYQEKIGKENSTTERTSGAPLCADHLS